MEIDAILIVKIVILALIHWMLVPLALQALIEKRRVIGGRKAPWAVAIVVVTCLGSLLYLIFHPQTQREPA
jgi:uncharacterized membrane protein YwzB